MIIGIINPEFQKVFLNYSSKGAFVIPVHVLFKGSAQWSIPYLAYCVEYSHTVLHAQVLCCVSFDCRHIKFLSVYCSTCELIVTYCDNATNSLICEILQGL